MKLFSLKKVIISIVLITGFIITILEGSKNILPIGSLFVGLILILALLALRLSGNFDRGKLRFSVFRLVFSTSLISLLLSYPIIVFQERFNREKANLLIVKVDEYKLKNGVYPQDLSMLANENLKMIPKAWNGIRKVDFFYECSNRTGNTSKYFYK